MLMEDEKGRDERRRWSDPECEALLRENEVNLQG
jgi:hypothetical protein